MSDILTSLWFPGNAEEAVAFYTSTVADSAIGTVLRAGADGPGGPAGSVIQVEFTLLGRPFNAINGQADFPFTDAISLVLLTDTQAEADEYWAAFTDGGEEIACGWCKDRYGLRWQICPKPAIELLSHPDPDVSRRATEAMYTMKRLDSEAMRRAAFSTGGPA